MAEIWGAAIAVAGAVGGAAMQADAAKKAGDKAAKGSEAGIAEQRRQYDTTRADTAPYRNIGVQALNALGAMYGYQQPKAALSFDAWAAQHPEAYVLPKAPKESGLGKHLRRMIDPTAPLRDAGIIGGSSGGGDKAYQQARARYQDYLNDYHSGVYGMGNGSNGSDVAPASGNAFNRPTSGPKMDPRQGFDASSGYQIGPGGSISRGIQAGPGVTIDNDTGEIIDPSTGSPYPVGATAAGPPMMAGPDYSNFFASPDYQFRKQQGTQGLERTASARGLTGSGTALAALADYNSNLAAGEFGNYFNRQAALAGIGQTAVNTATSAGMNAANNNSALLQSAANARASGIGDAADAWGNAFGTVAGIAYDRWGRPKKG